MRISRSNSYFSAQTACASRRGLGCTGGFYAAAPLILAIALVWPFGGGGTKVNMTAGKDTPAAQGTVQVQRGGKNANNSKLDIKVQSLAKPTALTPPHNNYVVWLEPDGQSPKNQGELRVDDKEKGELKAVTPHKRFKVFITAEQSPTAQQPSGPQVLSAKVVTS